MEMRTSYTSRGCTSLTLNFAGSKTNQCDVYDRLGVS